MEIFIGRRINPHTLADILNMILPCKNNVTVKMVDELPIPEKLLPAGPEPVHDDEAPAPGENVIRHEV